MRKIDKLILQAFISPFILTTVVATFILVVQYMMKYFDDFVGKDLGFDVFAELIFYFSLNMLQAALPLGVLVSSLMTFGNLGEHFELTAIKSAGISLLRALRPIFFFVVLLTIGAFYFNNYVVPAANLQAYSLLYDIKHKKPGLDIKEGVFYNGIPDYSIKVKEKLPDNETLKEVLIYDHTGGRGNNRVILADSSRMYMILNERYLKLELYNGNYYSEEPKPRAEVDDFYRTKFDRMDMVFNLSSFDLKRTKKELFQNNRQMKNIAELTEDIDSLRFSVLETKYGFFRNAKGFFTYHLDSVEIPLKKIVDEYDAKFRKEKQEEIQDEDSVKTELQASMLPDWELWQQQNEEVQDKDSVVKGRAIRERVDIARTKREQLSRNSIDRATALKNTRRNDKATAQVLIDTLSWDYLNAKSNKVDLLQTAKNQAQNIKVNLSSVSSRVDNLDRDLNRWIIEKWKKYSQAFACIVMFLIGAPLGSIIKKGGMGVPVIVSILFFLTYYIINIIFEKNAKEGLIDPAFAVWVADLSLLPIGLFFLRQARIDARLFDTDFYNIWIDKLKARFNKSK
ncbi:LptF/LptG family permease [Marinoscillum pacificum]|uniref:LptF/LptG family permease n=1 Tax=Marinoscillum pacificum TaxID=392723 RepID=UPI002157CF75|nr:LptF/LptG family permease [Marinoscillum pacificum]